MFNKNVCCFFSSLFLCVLNNNLCNSHKRCITSPSCTLFISYIMSCRGHHILNTPGINYYVLTYPMYNACLGERKSTDCFVSLKRAINLPSQSTFPSHQPSVCFWLFLFCLFGFSRNVKFMSLSPKVWPFFNLFVKFYPHIPTYVFTMLPHFSIPLRFWRLWSSMYQTNQAGAVKRLRSHQNIYMIHVGDRLTNSALVRSYRRKGLTKHTFNKAYPKGLHVKVNVKILKICTDQWSELRVLYC